MICIKRRLNGEIERINQSINFILFLSKSAYIEINYTAVDKKRRRWQENILLDNGYSKNVNAHISRKIARFSTLKRFGPEKFPVYLRVPWISKPSINLEKEVKTAVEGCYGSVSTHLVFTSMRMVPVARKDVPSTTQKSLSYMNISATVIVGT